MHGCSRLWPRDERMRDKKKHTHTHFTSSAASACSFSTRLCTGQGMRTVGCVGYRASRPLGSRRLRRTWD